MMARRKTTVYVDEDILKAAKVYAARKDMRDSEVFENALRSYLGIDLLNSVWEHNRDFEPEEAERLAYEALEAARVERGSRSRS
jgi:hypothetical protein